MTTKNVAKLFVTLAIVAGLIMGWIISKEIRRQIAQKDITEKPVVAIFNASPEEFPAEGSYLKVDFIRTGEEADTAYLATVE